LELRFLEVLRYADLLLWGALLSVVLATAAGVAGLLLGILCAEGQRLGHRGLTWAIRAYVEFIRNTPFLVQLFFVFFGLPSLGLRLDALSAALIALVLNIAAYFTEILRAGLEASPAGQAEAGRALGLRRWQIFLLVQLRPALAKVWPALVSQFVLVFLGSAVVSQISVEDLTFQGQFIQSRTFRAFEIYLVITLLYAGLAFALRRALLELGARLFPWQRRGA